MAIPLKLQVFEGPMDLLMHLIEKNKIDIYDIPIVTITDQYLDYVHQMEHNDMNVTSEFLVMAATLLDIKSRMLLPREENEEGEEEDPRDELVRRLLEYKMYKYMSEELKEKNRHAGMSYFRPQDLPEEVRSYVPPLNYEELIGDRTVQSLETVFKDVLKRKKSRVDPIRSGFGKIQKEEISVADKELYIRAYLTGHPHADFREMLELENSKEEIIVTFLVILELMKHQKIRITQEEAFGRILIDLIDPGEEKAKPEYEPEPMPETKAASAMTVASVTASIPEAEPIRTEIAEYASDRIELPEPAADPTPEPEEEPKAPAKRHLVYRSGQHRLGGGRYVFRYAVGRKRIFFFHKMRGNRIWKRNRKRNKGKHV
ncbi:MAG: segregation/condensation protein A [Lachnospiraceae bacterium]|nr:segregation/condensation protein A [Lachnospiraceae bacterium]